MIQKPPARFLSARRCFYHQLIQVSWAHWGNSPSIFSLPLVCPMVVLSEQHIGCGQPFPKPFMRGWFAIPYTGLIPRYCESSYNRALSLPNSSTIDHNTDAANMMPINKTASFLATFSGAHSVLVLGSQLFSVTVLWDPSLITCLMFSLLLPHLCHLWPLCKRFYATVTGSFSLLDSSPQPSQGPSRLSSSHLFLTAACSSRLNLSPLFTRTFFEFFLAILLLGQPPSWLSLATTPWSCWAQPIYRTAMTGLNSSPYWQWQDENDKHKQQSNGWTARKG